jgi:hypothetical protein
MSIFHHRNNGDRDALCILAACFVYQASVLQHALVQRAVTAVEHGSGAVVAAWVIIQHLKHCFVVLKYFMLLAVRNFSLAALSMAPIDGPH